MCDLLGLPNAQKLIDDYKKSKSRVGDKRSSDTMVNDTSDIKKRKLSPSISTSTASSSKGESPKGESSKIQEHSKAVNGESSKVAKEGESNEFLSALRDMFPDADGLFLISESQHLKDWEECSRFINTVMISGLYPKKGGDDSWKQPLPDSDDDIAEITDTSVYRSILNVSDGDTDEDTPVEIKRKKPKASNTLSKTNVPEEEVIEISSDSTEPYEVPPVNTNSINTNVNKVVLGEVVNEDTRMSLSLPESTSSDTTIDWDKQMADELDFLLNDGELTAINAPLVKEVKKIIVREPQPTVATVINGDAETGLVTSTSELNRTKDMERDLLELLAIPSTSNSAPPAKKIKDPLIEAEKIVEQGKKILEVANLLAKKDKSPSAKAIGTYDNPNRSLLKKLKVRTDLMEIEPAALEAIVPDIDDRKTKTPVVENPDSSNASIPARIKTPPPGPSGLQRQVTQEATIVFNDEEAMETANVAGNNAAANAQEENPSEEDKKMKWVDEQTANLIRIFPNSDPTFLKAECMKMDCSDNALNEFVFSKLENNDMPTRAEYEKRIEMEELQNRYTNNFVIEDFLKAIPDPWAYFSDTKRNAVKYKQHSFAYLKSEFKKHYVKDIQEALKNNRDNLYLAYQHIKKNVSRQRTVKRSEFECSGSRPTTIDIQFLQEVSSYFNFFYYVTFCKHPKGRPHTTLLFNIYRA